MMEWVEIGLGIYGALRMNGKHFCWFLNFSGYTTFRPVTLKVLQTQQRLNNQGLLNSLLEQKKPFGWEVETSSRKSSKHSDSTTVADKAGANSLWVNWLILKQLLRQHFTMTGQSTVNIRVWKTSSSSNLKPLNWLLLVYRQLWSLHECG